MRLPLGELLQKLAVEHEMVPYETRPWVHYDEERGITCSAEVRMGTDGKDFEVEVQFLYDDPEQARLDFESSQKDEEDDDGDTDSSGGNPPGVTVEPVEVSMIQQKLFVRARMMGTETWSPVYLTLKREDYTNKVGEWEEKSCNIFRLCVQAINMEEIPDIEELIKSEMDEGWGGRGRRGRVGRKSPKVKPGALLGMKKPGG